MKKLAMILFLLFGVSSFVTAQASPRAKVEHLFYKYKGEVQPRKQMSHFAKAPRDKKLRHNGTQKRRKQCMTRNHDVVGDGFKSYKKFGEHEVNEDVKKVRNKNTGTYTMK